MSNDRPIVALPPDVRERLAREVHELRAGAVARYTEVDLLVAALREHIEDLRAERDHLRAELAYLQRRLVTAEEAARIANTTWLVRGIKPPR
ncbi:MAG: hypothetical protein Kow0010_13860 [Dehalococcoidia bacterium]